MKDNTNRHILYLTPGFPRNDEDSYTVTYFVNFLEQIRLSHPEIKLSVISFLYPNNAAEYSWKGIDVYAMGAGNTKIKKVWFWYKVMKKAKELHSKNAISCVHALWFRECALLAKRISNALRLKAVCTVMGTELIQTNHYLKLIKPEDFKMVGVSKRQEVDYQSRFKRLFDQIIPWGIPSEFVQKDIVARKHDILFAGFLNEVKNLPFFLEIVKELVPNFPEINIQIFGEDYSNGGWQNKLINMGLEDNVSICGVVKNKEMLAIMHNSKILLHTSRFETQGYVIWEALASGMHVISTPVGIVEKSSDKLLIAEGKSDFVRIATRILNNYKPSAGFNPNDIEKTVNSYIQLYECI